MWLNALPMPVAIPARLKYKNWFPWKKASGIVCLINHIPNFADKIAGVNFHRRRHHHATGNSSFATEVTEPIIEVRFTRLKKLVQVLQISEASPKRIQNRCRLRQINYLQRFADVPGSKFWRLTLLSWNALMSHSLSFSLASCCRQSMKSGYRKPPVSGEASSAMVIMPLDTAPAANWAMWDLANG